MAQSIVEAVAVQAQREPERTAIIFESEIISYGMLYADVERFAQALVVAGLKPGERVGLFLDNSPAFAVAYLGAHLAGGVVTLINTQYRQVELSHIMTAAAVRVCVTSPAGAAELRLLSLSDLRLLIIVGQEELVPELEPEPAAQPLQPTHPMQSVAYQAFLRRGDDPGAVALSLAAPSAEAPAVIGYTSGTTGRAKGALLLHRNLIANITAITTAWRWTPDDRLLLTLPLFHTHELGVGLHGTLFMGGSALLHRKFDASAVLAVFRVICPGCLSPARRPSVHTCSESSSGSSASASSNATA